LNKNGFWGPWHTFKDGHGFSKLSLKETLQGGQCFDWESLSDLYWRGKIGDSVIECKWEESEIFWRCERINPVEPKCVENYFWLDQDYQQKLDQLPWRSDPVLGKCIKQLSGLRILRQPLGQTLFYFLLSSAKSIPQIQAIGTAVCERYGKELFPGIFSFPGWAKLAEVSEEDLRSLKLGYRAKYVVQTAKIIVSQPNWLQTVQSSCYEDAKVELLRLPGVGEKVADCALLFGGMFLEAFPMDTWIEKSLEKRYFLNGWKSSHKIHFAKIHFGEFAGLAQQFLFSGERLGILK
jgi:N-glycosylase/DNA lyase